MHRILQSAGSLQPSILFNRPGWGPWRHSEAPGSTLSVNTSFVSWKIESTAAFFSSRESPRFLLCISPVSASNHSILPAQQPSALRTISQKCLRYFICAPHQVLEMAPAAGWLQLQDAVHFSPGAAL